MTNFHQLRSFFKQGHCEKSVRIRSFSGTHFPALGVFWSELGKIQTRKTPNAKTFHAMGKIWKSVASYLNLFYQMLIQDTVSKFSIFIEFLLVLG